MIDMIQSQSFIVKMSKISKAPSSTIFFDVEPVYDEYEDFEEKTT
jgi:hypothetical protein